MSRRRRIEKGPPTYLPVGPLVDLIHRRARAHDGRPSRDNDGEENLRALSHELAANLGTGFEAANRRIHRVLSIHRSGDGWIRWDAADELVCALGRHPAHIWGWDMWGLEEVRHGDHPCEVCSKVFRYPGALDSHIENEHGREEAV